MKLKQNNIHSKYSQKKIRGFISSRLKHLQEVEDIREQYYQAMKIMGNDNQAVAAIVTFRSMEGVQRAKHAFMHSWIFKRLNDICCTCCYKKNYQNIKFKDSWLGTSLSVEPELLLWQNYALNSFLTHRRQYYGFQIQRKFR